MAGIAGFQVGSARVEAEVGTGQVIAPGTPHTWWNGGNDELRLRAVLRPALSTEAMLRALFAAANRRGAALPDAFTGARWMLRVKPEYQLVRPPVLVQRVVFPLTVLIGTLLGKYPRGEAS